MKRFKFNNKKQINIKAVIILLLLSCMVFSASCGGSVVPVDGNEGVDNSASDTNPNAAIGNENDETITDNNNDEDLKDVNNADNTAAIDNSETEISVMTQEYIGDNIAEILMISYNGQQPALEEYGWRNPEIEMLNNAIKNGIQQIYNEFIGREKVDLIDEREWIEIRSYPFTSDEWLQIVTHYNIYPTYGISGHIESYNFNKKENRFFSVYDAIEAEGVTEESFIAEATELFIQQSPGMTVDEVKAVGFKINQGSDGSVTQFWFEVTAKNEYGDSWQGIFSYVRGYQFTEIIGEFLYDTDAMDVMDPPLSYQKDFTASLSEDAAMTILREALAVKIEEWSANVYEGNSIAIVSYGETVIDGNECWSFALGTNSPESFTAEEHYVVSKVGGTIYYMNILNEGKYEVYGAG